MRTILVASLVTAIAFHALRTPGRAQNERPEGIAQNSQDNQRPANQSPRPVNGQTANEQQKQSGGVTSTNSEQTIRVSQLPEVSIKPHKDIYDKTLVFATSLLVIVGGFQIYFLWGTVRAARDNAVAAKLNAEALQASARAWVTFYVRGNAHKAEVGEAVDAAIRDGTVLDGMCTCRNEGKTPAWIIEKRIHLLVGTPESLPDDPPLELTRVFQSEPEPLGADAQSEPRRWLAEAEGKWDDTKIAVIYGIVKYRDVFYRSERDIRTTTFGYVWITDDGVSTIRFDRLAGHPKYNMST